MCSSFVMDMPSIRVTSGVLSNTNAIGFTSKLAVVTNSTSTSAFV